MAFFGHDRRLVLLELLEGWRLFHLGTDVDANEDEQNTHEERDAPTVAHELLGAHGRGDQEQQPVRQHLAQRRRHVDEGAE